MSELVWQKALLPSPKYKFSNNSQSSLCEKSETNGEALIFQVECETRLTLAKEGFGSPRLEAAPGSVPRDQEKSLVHVPNTPAFPMGSPWAGFCLASLGTLTVLAQYGCPVEHRRWHRLPDALYSVPVQCGEVGRNSQLAPGEERAGLSTCIPASLGRPKDERVSHQF